MAFLGFKHANRMMTGVAYLAGLITAVVLLGSGISGCLAAGLAVPFDLSESLRQDGEALLALRREIGCDLDGALEDWGLHPYPCRWHGIECLPDQRANRNTKAIPVDLPVAERVTGLELVGLNLGASVLYHIGKLSQLRTLVIRGNRFKESQIPASILNCSKLSILDLRGNDFTGQINFNLADFPSLKVLRLSHNRLSGTLDVLFSKHSTFGRMKRVMSGRDRSSKEEADVKSFCARLEFLDLAHNFFSGSLPSAIGQCMHMQRLELQENALGGSIPASLAVPKLRVLQLNKNFLDGFLPSTLATGCGGGVLVLNVTSNLLRGRIPNAFAELDGDDRRFYFTDNLFEGPIPLGKWNAERMFQRGSFSGNPGLCGWPSDRICEGAKGLSGELDGSMAVPRLINNVLKFPSTLHSWLLNSGRVLMRALSTQRSRFLRGTSIRRSMEEADEANARRTSSKKKNSTLKRWLLGIGVGLSGGVVAALTAVTVVRMVATLFGKDIEEDLPIIFHPKISSHMLKFLERDDAFVKSEMVGAGGAARVYRMQLENGMVVAVKSVKVKEDQKGFGQKQIQSELETLGYIRHRNLVALLAYVHRPDHHLLIYKYMQNGSLYQVLRRLKDGQLELPWLTRHKIAVETCEGLTYLHFHSRPRVVHRDLKPSNILLDENFRAHVSDFGLAKVIGVGDNYVSTGLAGTVGYIAPEYSQTCRFTDKGDVYAFGVVLAGLLTGKDPTEKFFQTAYGCNMGSWLQDLMLKGEAKSAVDPKLSIDGFEEEVLLGIRVAVFCMSVNPSDRPNSQQVLAMLNDIRVVDS